MPSTTLRQARPSSEERAEALDLLRRYPDVTTNETETLIGLVDELTVVEMNSILADPSVGRQLDLLHRDHGRRLRPSVTQAIVVAALPTLAIMILALLVAHMLG